MTLALIAHDNKKEALIAFVKKHQEGLKSMELVATGTTGRMIMEATDLAVTAVLSVPGATSKLGAWWPGRYSSCNFL